MRSQAGAWERGEILTRSRDGFHQLGQTQSAQQAEALIRQLRPDGGS